MAQKQLETLLLRQFNRARWPYVVPGNMGGGQFVILAERGLIAIVDGFDIPALG